MNNYSKEFSYIMSHYKQDNPSPEPVVYTNICCGKEKRYSAEDVSMICTECGRTKLYYIPGPVPFIVKNMYHRTYTFRRNIIRYTDIMPSDLIDSMVSIYSMYLEEVNSKMRYAPHKLIINMFLRLVRKTQYQVTNLPRCTPKFQAKISKHFLMFTKKYVNHPYIQMVQKRDAGYYTQVR
jgi:hypothetical protein